MKHDLTVSAKNNTFIRLIGDVINLTWNPQKLSYKTVKIIA